MASLPPVVVGKTSKLNPEFKKLSSPSLPFEKKNYSTKELDRAFESFSLEFREALSLIGGGKQIHGYIVKYDIEYDASTGNALCSLYSKCRSLDLAINAFKRIEEKNVISWTAVISACGENGNSAMGLDMFVQMLAEGVQPNEFTLTSVLSLCCTMQALDVGTQVHSLSMKIGCGSDLAAMQK
ncbi:Pentatricopeptide repeat-containing protein [Sesamum alatum]|uniref:Pentatricopeptide repeat-containing protein n=1 Tax=Sesamum alatum TaxID=300844 RepID=A0AAE1YFS0_9LAMI|nr:Pentatricopeptide repeat-containing protein [Sesamum alatum]